MTELPRVLELRVHGVSWTPPHSMLGLEHACDVHRLGKGDRDTLTGFYRAKNAEDTSGPELPDDAEREAYSWGALTSSASGLLGWLHRALWLTLLPFAMVNVAMWSRPGLNKPTLKRTVAAILVRTAGLFLTALLVATACGIGIDLVAWQCFRDGIPVCPVLPGFMNFLASDAFNDPGRRLAVGQALPLLVLVGFWWLSRTTIKRYEAYPLPAAGTSAGDGPAPTSGVVMSHRTMWDGEKRTSSLSYLHLALGVVLVVWFTAWPMARLGQRGYWFVLTVAVAALLAVFVLVAVWLGVYDQPEYSDTPAKQRHHGESLVLLVLAIVLLVLHTVHLLLPAGSVTESGYLPGVGWVPGALVFVLFGLAAALVGVSRSVWTVLLPVVPMVAAVAIALLVDAESPGWFWALLAVLGIPGFLGAWWHRAARRQECAWGGAAPAILVGAAILVAILFSTGLTLLAAGRLNDGPPISRFAIPYEEVPTPAVLRLGTGVRLEQGWVEFTTTETIVRGGQLLSATLDDATTVSETLASRLLTKQTLHLPGRSLSLADTCVTQNGPSTRLQSANRSLPTAAGADYAVIRVNFDPAGELPPQCGNGLAPPVRAVATMTPTVLTVPQSYAWFATALPLLFVGILVTLPWPYLRLRRRAYADLDGLANEELNDYPEDDRRECSRARHRAAFSHRAEAILSVLSVPAVAAAILIAVGVLWDSPPWKVIASVSWFVHYLANFGLLLAVGLALALVGLGTRMRASETLRRSVGVLWDLSTFWPRAAHPFGPPCYAERVVPQVIRRTRQVLATENGQVVLSGHSQGSTICVAVLMQMLDDPAFSRVRFVSYGSQLRTWYGRVFPDMLGPDVLGHEPTDRPMFGTAAPDAPSTSGTPFLSPKGTLAARLGVGVGVGGKDPRWRSLFRRTDPIGFRVHQDSDGDNPIDRRVLELPAPQPGRSAQKVETHGNYPATPEYIEVVGPWLQAPVPPNAGNGVPTPQDG